MYLVDTSVWVDYIRDRGRALHGPDIKRKSLPERAGVYSVIMWYKSPCEDGVAMMNRVAILEQNGLGNVRSL